LGLLNTGRAEQGLLSTENAEQRLTSPAFSTEESNEDFEKDFEIPPRAESPRCVIGASEDLPPCKRTQSTLGGRTSSFGHALNLLAGKIHRTLSREDSVSRMHGA